MLRRENFVGNKSNGAELQCNDNPPIRHLIRDNFHADEEETCSDRDVVLEKDAVNTTNVTVGQRASLNEKYTDSKKKKNQKDTDEISAPYKEEGGQGEMKTHRIYYKKIAQS